MAKLGKMLNPLESSFFLNGSYHHCNHGFAVACRQEITIVTSFSGNFGHFNFISLVQGFSNLNEYLI